MTNINLTTGQIEGQEVIDIDQLNAELTIPAPYKVFVDTIDEQDRAFIDGEVLVVHIARSRYDSAADKYALVKTSVMRAVAEHLE